MTGVQCQRSVPGWAQWPRQRSQHCLQAPPSTPPPLQAFRNTDGVSVSHSIICKALCGIGLFWNALMLGAFIGGKCVKASWVSRLSR